MKKNEPDIIEVTADFWRQRTKKKVTDEDARRMINNVSAFFRLLAEWDKREQKNNQGN